VSRKSSFFIIIIKKKRIILRCFLEYFLTVFREPHKADENIIVLSGINKIKEIADISDKSQAPPQR